MKNAGIKRLSKAFITALIGIVFGVGIFGVSLVHRERLKAEHGPALVCHTQDCENQDSDPICASSCLSAFESSLQALPANFSHLTVFNFIFSILFVVAWNFIRESILNNLKLFIRKRRERFVLSYFTQIGSWLVLLGKRDPSLVFASI